MSIPILARSIKVRGGLHTFQTQTKEGMFCPFCARHLMLASFSPLANLQPLDLTIKLFGMMFTTKLTCKEVQNSNYIYSNHCNQ